MSIRTVDTLDYEVITKKEHKYIPREVKDILNVNNETAALKTKKIASQMRKEGKHAELKRIQDKEFHDLKEKVLSKTQSGLSDIDVDCVSLVFDGREIRSDEKELSEVTKLKENIPQQSILSFEKVRKKENAEKDKIKENFGNSEEGKKSSKVEVCFKEERNVKDCKTEAKKEVRFSENKKKESREKENLERGSIVKKKYACANFYHLRIGDLRSNETYVKEFKSGICIREYIECVGEDLKKNERQNSSGKSLKDSKVEKFSTRDKSTEKITLSGNQLDKQPLINISQNRENHYKSQEKSCNSNLVKIPLRPYNKEISPSRPFNKEIPSSRPYNKDISPSRPFNKEIPSSRPYNKEISPSRPFNKEIPSSRPYSKDISPSRPFNKGIPRSGPLIKETPHLKSESSSQNSAFTFNPNSESSAFKFSTTSDSSRSPCLPKKRKNHKNRRQDIKKRAKFTESNPLTSSPSPLFPFKINSKPTHKNWTDTTNAISNSPTPDQGNSSVSLPPFLVPNSNPPNSKFLAQKPMLPSPPIVLSQVPKIVQSSSNPLILQGQNPKPLLPPKNQCTSPSLTSLHTQTKTSTTSQLHPLNTQALTPKQPNTLKLTPKYYSFK